MGMSTPSESYRVIRQNSVNSRYESRRAARKNIERDIMGGFTEIEGLVSLLDEYESQKDKYPDIESFLPQIKNYFEIYLGNL